MAATMDKLQDTGKTWGDEIRTYETQTRRAVHEDLLKGPNVRVTHGFVKSQERAFDPLLQRYRDRGTEIDQRVHEESARVAHLNRAQDIQILREQPYNVVTNESRLEPLHQGEPLRIGPQRPPRKKYPDTFVDYNILSNIPQSLHHWAPPGQRPQPAERAARVREVPAFTQKDYNIISTRYLADHDSKIARDRELNLLEATAKHRARNRFDPVNQTYVCPAEEERMRTFTDAHEVEIVERAQQQIPPSIKNRQTSFYNMVNHDVANADMLKWYDLAEDERKERFKNRYIVEHNYHIQDIKHDHIEHSRKLNRVSLERYEEPIKRGFDIVTNNRFHGRDGQGLAPPYPLKKLTPWERTQEGRSLSLPPGSGTGRSQRTPGTGKKERSSRTPSVAAMQESPGLPQDGPGLARSQPCSRTPSVASMVNAIDVDVPLPANLQDSPTANSGAQRTLLPAEARQPRRSTPAPSRSGSGTGLDVTRPPRAPSVASSAPRAPSVAGSAASRPPSVLRAPSPMDHVPMGRSSPSPGGGSGPALGRDPGSLASLRASPPPPPIPGSPVGSVYSKPTY